MKVLSVVGTSKSGKTTTIEKIIEGLKKRGYSVGSVKEIHYEKFAIDQEGTNTYRHKMAGADPVTARGYKETDILFGKSLDIEDILAFYKNDYVIMEGVTESSCPIILCAHSKEDIEDKKNEQYFKRVFLISGVAASSMQEYKGLRAIDAIKDAGGLIDIIEDEVFERLPDFPPDCCSACGSSCRELSSRILKGKAERGDCVLYKASITLKVNEKEIPIVPFVQGLLRDSILALVKNLKGCEKPSKISIKIFD